MKELWNERFSAKAYIYGTLPNRYFASKLSEIKPGRLLLPGEGEGRNAVFAASLGFEVDAIDFSEQARIKALALAQNRQLHLNYIVADLLFAELAENHYDVAAEIFVHLPFNARRQWHSKLIRSLRTGAFIIIEAYHVDQLRYRTGGPQQADLLYTAEDLVEDFPGFDILQLDEVVEEMEEGLMHRGPSALVRLFARKL